MSQYLSKANKIIRILQDQAQRPPPEHKENHQAYNRQAKSILLTQLLGTAAKPKPKRESSRSRQQSPSPCRSSVSAKGRKKEKEEEGPTRLERIMRLKVDKPKCRSVVKQFLRNSEICLSRKKVPPLFGELQEEERKVRCLSSHFSRLNFEIEREARSLIVKQKKTQTLKDHLQKEFERQREIALRQRKKRQDRRSKDADREDRKEYYRVMREAKRVETGREVQKERLARVKEQLRASAGRRLRLEDDIGTTLNKIIGRGI